MRTSRFLVLAALSVVWLVTHVTLGLAAGFALGLVVSVVADVPLLGDALGTDPRSEYAKLRNFPRPTADPFPLGEAPSDVLLAGLLFGAIGGVVRVVGWLRAAPPASPPLDPPEEPLPFFLVGLIAGAVVPAAVAVVLALVSTVVWLVTGYETLSTMLPPCLLVATLPGLLVCIAGWEVPPKPHAGLLPVPMRMPPDGK